MHELGVTFYIVKDVKKAAEEAMAETVKSVTLQLGEVTTVIPDQLVDCWNWAVNKEEGPIHGAELRIEIIDAVTFCEDCKREYPTVEYGKTCPLCGSENTYLIKGNEVFIKEIEVE